MAERAAAVLGDAGLLLGVRRPHALPTSFQEVSQHLTFALHADLAAAHKVVVVRDEAMDVLRHLERKFRRMTYFKEWVNMHEFPGVMCSSFPGLETLGYFPRSTPM